MKKLLFLLMTLLLGWGNLWADTVQELKLDDGATQIGTYFTVAKASGSPSYNSAYTGKYEGTTYSKGLKMESGTTITFTTTASSSTVIIVQATKKSGNDNTGGINFDNTNYAHTTANVLDDANNENVRVYTISDVAAAEHTIARNSESGLFYVKVVENDDAQLTTVDIPTTWTFTSANNIMGTSTLDATTIKSNMEFIATGGTKIYQNTDNINLGGGAAYLHFKAPANCTVTVNAYNSSAETSDRYLHISTGSKNNSNDLLNEKLTSSAADYAVSIAEASDVYVYCSGGGIKITSVAVTAQIDPVTPTITVNASGAITVSDGRANVDTGSVITLSSSFEYNSTAIDASNFDVVYNIINLSSDANAATISGDQLSVGHAAGKFQVQAVATSKSLLYNDCTTTVEFQVNNTGGDGNYQDTFNVSDFGYANNENGTNSSNNQLDRTLKGFSFVFTGGEAVKYNNNDFITLRRSGDSYGKLAINEDNQGKCKIYKADITYRSTADATLATNATTAEGGETLFLPSTSGGDKTISMLLGRSFFTMQMASDATVLIKSVKLYYDNGDTGGSLTQTLVTPTLTFSPTAVTAIPESDVTEPTLTTSPKTLNVTYSSSNTDVATVNATTGVVTAVAEGTATITATYAGTTTYLNAANGTYTLTVASIPEAVTFSPTSGEVTSGTTVTLATATTSATIYYTTDGTTPTKTSTEYTDPIAITEAQTIRAVAINTAGSSAISSATYTIAATPEGLQTISEHDWTFDSEAFDKEAGYGYALVDGKTLEIFGSKSGKENNFQKSSTAIKTSDETESFNYYMKFENSKYNSTEADANTLSDNNRRYFHFKVNAVADKTKKTKIVLYGSTGSNGSERSGVIAVGTFSNTVATLTNSNSKQAATVEYTFTESGVKDVWVYAPSSAFQFYKILVTSDKKALTTFRSMGSQTYDQTHDVAFNHTIFIQPENAISDVNDITITSSDPSILDISAITKTINTTNGRLVIGNIRPNQGGTATLTVNFAGNSTYAAATYTTRAFNVTGPTQVLITAEDQDIQQGQFSTINPVFTDKNGSPIGIKEVSGSYVTYVLGEDEEEPDYTTYFNITYTAGTGDGENYDKITVDATGKIETEDDLTNPATMAAVGAYRYVTVTATPKAAYASAFTTSDAISTTVKLTIIEKVSQVQVDLYWDEECTDANKISTLTGDEWSISTTYASKDENKLYTFDKGIFASGFPNGRMIYAKVRNEGDSIWFSYAQNATPATIPANPKVDKKKRIFEYRRGLPIYFDGSLSGSDYIQVNIVATKWNSTTKKRELDGSVARMKFLIVSHDRPEKPTYSPVSPDADPAKNNNTDATFDNANGGKIMDTSQNVVAYGEGASDGVTGAKNIVYGKFSTESIYTTEQLINEQNVQRGIDNVPVVSTEVAKRRFTSVQIKSYTDEYGTADYISQQTYTEYWYLYDTRMTLTPAGNQYINVSGQAEPTATTTPTTNVVWYNKITKKWHNVLNQTVTYSIIDRNGADGTTINASTGVVTAGANPGWVRVKALYNVANEWHGGDSDNAKEAGNEPQYKSTTAPSETYFYVYIADPSQEEPEITPPTRKFTSSQAYIVKAPKNWDVRYTIDGSEPSATNGNFLGHGSTAENNTTATITVKAIAFNPDNTSQTSRIVSETYTLVDPIPDPIFDPDGVPAPWYYNTSNLIVQIACAYGGAEIYYTIDGSDPVIGAENTFKYSGLEKVTISGNVAIKAVAYSRTDDIYSNVVTSNYVYTTDMDLPYFQVSTDGKNWYGYDSTNSWVANGTKWNVGQSRNITPSTQIRIIDPNTVTGTIYYTTNGTAPAANSTSMIYKDGNPFTVAKTTTGKAIVTLEEASSQVATAVFNIDANTYHVWEAVESTTPGGKMTKEAGFVITTKPSLIVSNSMTDVNTNSIATSEGGSNSENITYAQPYITATFGGYDTNDWEHMTIADDAIGTPLDNVGEYNIKSSKDAKIEVEVDVTDNSGTVKTDNYNHYYSTLETVHERTFKVPSNGTYVRFEPERDGDLTIWILQHGSLNYHEGEVLTDKFIRCRPIYFVDEQGKSYKVKEVNGVPQVWSTARLSANWAKIKATAEAQGSSTTAVTNGWTDWKASQTIIYRGNSTPVENKGLNITESNSMYSIYNNYLTTNSINIGDPIKPFAIHNGNEISIQNGRFKHTSNDQTGYVMVSGGYAKYTFEVKAGKTYYFFGQGTKIGVRGFQFVPNTTEPATFKMIEGTVANTENSTAITAALNNGTRKTAEFDRTFAANTWTTLVLPFSVSATQVEQTFGEGTDIMHFDRIEGTKLYFYGHWHRMIVAGTPVFIKPTKSCNLNDLYVQVENNTPETMSSGGYTFQGYYNYGQNLAQNDYYISKAGNFCQWTNSATNIKSTRAVLHSNGSSAKLELVFNSIEDEDQATGIEVVYDEATDNVIVVKNANVYNTRGQLVRRNANSLDGLPKGVYIVNGIKYVVN
jgi:hypothetical protein